ncbi:bacitracin ABC transporter ATP-binding protein [Niastella vici]|uniref:Bacitracin ABC transporter ATP-binding protein n=1 Tax=Niastella vici TaxID=1703345 RepID=A0A1V9FR81_9BACT|nr:ABC transporter ATP-binding protein [Niastella vici]OQP60899.1 bacitracin ABC transporter ATP-binding protein [Niastella vici]
MSAIIKVSNLSKQYREVKAVNDISFTVNTGDIYGFLGQNGAGKSTTIRMLLTLIEPTAGAIELFGRNLYSHRKEVLQQIGAVIEKPDLYKYLTAYENLSLFAKMSGVAVTDKKLMDQLEQVGLTERAHSKVRTFSQGMKQRLGIAIALIHDPQLIILDEPTNGLDPQGIADIRNLILHLSRHQGKTILVSSHLLHEIELIANRMLIIDKGKKIMEGTVAELVDPARTMVHIEVTNPQLVMAWLQNSRWSACVQEQNNNVILLRMNKPQVPELTAELVNAGAHIMALQPQNSLESYFLSLTTENRHVDTFTN